MKKLVVPLHQVWERFKTEVSGFIEVPGTIPPEEKEKEESGDRQA